MTPTPTGKGRNIAATAPGPGTPQHSLAREKSPSTLDVQIGHGHDDKEPASLRTDDTPSLILRDPIGRSCTALRPGSAEEGHKAEGLVIDVFWEHISTSPPVSTRAKKRLAATNCMRIEVPFLLPVTPSTPESDFAHLADSQLQDIDGTDNVPFAGESDGQGAATTAAVESRDLDMDGVDSMTTEKDTRAGDTFALLSLPVEVRLEIYGYLLPQRTHTIISQYPHGGNYYTSAEISSNINYTQSFYPAPTPPDGAQAKERLTTYRLLNANFRNDYPNPSMNVEILRTCKAIHAEATPVLYGGQTAFDFSTYIDAVVPFFTDRGAFATSLVRKVLLAREIPHAVPDRAPAVGASVVGDRWWMNVCAFLTGMSSLRSLEMTVWSANGSAVLASASAPVPEREESESWRKWEYVHALTACPALREVKVRYWAFPATHMGFGAGAGEAEGEVGFDGWLAKRMVGDELMRERMVRGGIALEGIVVLPFDKAPAGNDEWFLGLN
jgi:hypothetical protein